MSRNRISSPAPYSSECLRSARPPAQPRRAQPRRAQFFSLDFIASITAFLVFFVIFFFVYGQLKLQTVQSAELKEAQDTAALLSDELVRTQGVPADWTNGTVVTIGLASEEGVLSINKTRALGNLSYQNSTFFLLVGYYDYFLNLTSVSTDGTFFSYGAYPPANATTITPIRRMVLFDNGTGRQLAMLRVVVWK